ncbi:hypothetical protein [Kushneria sp. EE4]
MKIFATCMECMKELGHPSFEPIIADYYDEPVAYIECARGHKSAFMLQSQKFEVLLESAANALLEGYTLEAASTLSSAYERFFEFAINVLCVKQKVKEEELEETFKQVSRQSERQMGAFLFLYLIEFGETYKINKNLVEFRNKVVHKGYIPTPSEIDGFGEKVYSEIYTITEKLKESCKDDIHTVIVKSMMERGKDLPSDMPRATSSGTMFFSLSKAENYPSFSEALLSYQDVRKMLIRRFTQVKASVKE